MFGRSLYRKVSALRALLDRIEREARRLEDSAEKLDRRLRLKGIWIDWRYVRGHGPYACLRWIEGGRKRAMYLGKKAELPKLPDKEVKVSTEKLRQINERMRKLSEACEKCLKILRNVVE